MKKFCLALVVALPLMALPGFAAAKIQFDISGFDPVNIVAEKPGQGIGKGKGKGRGNGPKAVPEIDAAGAVLAVALTGGLVALLRERRRRKK